MAGTSERSSVVLIAVFLSLLNLIIMIAGVLWVHDAFQEAEALDEGVAETIEARVGALVGVLLGIGKALLLGAFGFGLLWFIVVYTKASREAALHEQSVEFNSYLQNLSRDREGGSEDSSSGSENSGSCKNLPASARRSKASI